MAEELADGTEPSGSRDDWRVATEDDTLGLMALLARMHEEDFWKRYPLNRAKTLQMVQRCLRDGIVFVVEKEGQIVASASLMPDPLWFSDDYMLVEIWFYVRKGHRRSTYAEQLIRACKNFADDLGVDMHLGVMTMKQAGRKNSLFRRHLSPAGEGFLHLVEKQEDE